MLKPYPYQRKCLGALRLARNSGRKRALVVMATGLGKTMVSAFEIKALLKQAPGPVLYLCHNKDILRQARKTFEEVLGDSYTYGYFHGTEKHLGDVDVLFASFQTMAKWLDRFGKNAFRYIVVDEVHHGHAATFRPIIEYFEPEWMVGLTATPERSDGLDITTLFEGPPVFNLGIFKALARRYLCDVDYRIMTDEIQKLEVLDTPVGKLSIAELNRTVFVPKRDEEIARIIQQKAAEEFENPRVMIFCASIEHAERMAKLMPHAAIVHSKLKTKEKDRRLDAFRSGEVSTVLTVDMLNEGIDVPEANVIVFLRSTASRRIFLQQLGRGLRKALGKLKVLVLDFVANCERIEMIDQLQQGVRDALNGLPSGPKADDETSEARSAFTLTLDGGEFDERVWRLVELVTIIRTRPTLTVEFLTKQLLRKAEQLGRPPTQHEVNNDPAMASATAFLDAFQTSWNGVLRAVGLTPIHGLRYSLAELREQLLRKAKELGRTPTSIEVNADPCMAAVSVFTDIFQTTWNGVVREVGLTPTRRTDVAADDLRPILLRKAEELGRPLTTREVLADSQLPVPLTVMKAFDKTSLSSVWEELGITPLRQRGHTKESLTLQLLQKAKELSRTPTARDVDCDPRMASSKTFLKVFEMTWNEMIESIGLTPTRASRHKF